MNFKDRRAQFSRLAGHRNEGTFPAVDMNFKDRRAQFSRLSRAQKPRHFPSSLPAEQHNFQGLAGI